MTVFPVSEHHLDVNVKDHSPCSEVESTRCSDGRVFKIGLEFSRPDSIVIECIVYPNCSG